MPTETRHILLVESSATQRYVLLKLLRADGYETTSVESYDHGLTLVNALQNPNGHPSAVVLGWPAQTNPAADEILTLLESKRLVSVPVLLLSHEPDAALKAWVARRAHTAVIDWNNRDSLTETLQSLFAVGSLPPLSEPCPSDTEQPVNILLVDDSPSVRSYYRKLLLRHGYNVEVASNVKEGYEKAEHGGFDIAIIDYFMPDANGDVLCRRLLNNFPSKGLNHRL